MNNDRMQQPNSKYVTDDTCSILSLHMTKFTLTAFNNSVRFLLLLFKGLDCTILV